MLTNYLMLRIKDRDEAAIQKVARDIEELPARIECLKSVKVCRDVRGSAASYDLIAVEEFETMQDYEAYGADPVHMEAAKYIVSVLEASASILAQE